MSSSSFKLTAPAAPHPRLTLALGLLAVAVYSVVSLELAFFNSHLLGL